MGTILVHTEFWQEIPKYENLENLSGDGSIILKIILEKKNRECVLDLTGSGYGPVVGCCENGIESSGYIEF
jgi:hypothetical protein